VLCGGEVVSRALVTHAMTTLGPACAFHNSYGPTETTVYATYGQCSFDDPPGAVAHRSLAFCARSADTRGAVTPTSGETVPRIAVVLALMGLLAVPAVAGAAPANTVTVVGTQTSLHQSGNSVTFTETLRLGRRVVGSDKVTCNGVSGNIYNCRAKFTLSNGTITAAGRYNQARVNNQIRITGGTA
jgi:hypothetical protein